MRPVERRTLRPKTAAQIALEAGCCERTVRNHWAQDRAEYEANSLMRLKPWEALGMSRATWYNKGKPSPEAKQKLPA